MDSKEKHCAGTRGVERAPYEPQQWAALVTGTNVSVAFSRFTFRTFPADTQVYYVLHRQRNCSCDSRTPDL